MSHAGTLVGIEELYARYQSHGLCCSGVSEQTLGHTLDFCGVVNSSWLKMKPRN
jgi:hypothetical protein